MSHRTQVRSPDLRRRAADIVADYRRRRLGYTPEWSPEDRDPGLAVVQAEAAMLASLWERIDQVAQLSITAKAFCHQMVRSIVALCVDVGTGKKAATDAPTILAARDRNVASGAAPPEGLTLWDVDY